MGKKRRGLNREWVLEAHVGGKIFRTRRVWKTVPLPPKMYLEDALFLGKKYQDAWPEVPHRLRNVKTRDIIMCDIL